MSVYLELTQKTAEGSTYSISATNTILDSANGFVTAGIIAGSKLRLSGWSIAGNNTDVIVSTVAAGTIVTTTSPLTIEAANAVTVTKTDINFYSSGNGSESRLVSGAGTGLDIFTAGNKIIITGSTRNNQTVTVQNTTASTITIEENLFLREEPGATVVIKQLNNPSSLL